MEHKDVREKHSKEILFLAKENNDLYFFLFYRHTIRIDLDKQASQMNLFKCSRAWGTQQGVICIALTSIGILFSSVFQSTAGTMLTADAAQACQMSPRGERSKRKVTNACSLLCS